HAVHPMDGFRVSLGAQLQYIVTVDKGRVLLKTRAWLGRSFQVQPSRIRSVRVEAAPSYASGPQSPFGRPHDLSIHEDERSHCERTSEVHAEAALGCIDEFADNLGFLPPRLIFKHDAQGLRKRFTIPQVPAPVRSRFHCSQE